MPTTPYAQALVSVNGGTPVAGAVPNPETGLPTVAVGNTLQLSPASTAGWTACRWELYATPPGFTAPTGWTVDTDGSVTGFAGAYYYAATGGGYSPPVITQNVWGDLLWRLLVNGAVVGNDPTGQLTDMTGGASILSPHGLADLADFEQSQFGGWAKRIRATYRAIEAALTSGGGTTPTGTGFPHITSGTQDGAARAVNLASADVTGVLAAANGGTVGTRTTLEQFDALAGSSSSHDCTAAFASALATGLPIELGWDRTYYLPSTVSLPAGATVYGKGYNTVLFTDQNTDVFNVTGASVTIQDVRFLGNWNTATATSNQNGIRNGTTGGGAAGFQNFRGINLVFDHLNGAGLYTANDVGSFQGNYLANPQFLTCAVGFLSDTTGEYWAIEGIQANGCSIAVSIKGGNCNLNGGHITGNAIGVQLLAGSNDAHGSVTGVLINHNTFHCLDIGGIANGFLFEGCEVYYGNIFVQGAQGLIFRDCVIDVPALFFDVNTTGVFDNCLLPLSVGNPPLIYNYAGSSTAPASCWVEWRNTDVGLSNLSTANSATDTGKSIRGLQSTIGTTALSYTPTNLSAGQTVIFTSVTSTIQAIQGTNLNTPYSTSTGAWTCGGWGRGRTRLHGNLALTKAAGDSFASLDVQVQLNGTAVAHIPIAQTSTTAGFASFDLAIETKASDTLKLVFVASATFTGNVGVGAASIAVAEGL